MKKILTKSLRRSIGLCSLIAFAVSGASCKPAGSDSGIQALGGATAVTDAPVIRMSVVLGYGGLTIQGRGQNFRFEGGNQQVPGTNLAVFDKSGKQISGVIVRRLEVMENHGTATTKNGIVSLNMGLKGVPTYSIDVEFGDLFCSSLDKKATLVVGVMGDLACFRKNTDQGAFVKSCLQAGALGHVEIKGANPVCISRVPPLTDSISGAESRAGRRQKTGDPLMLDYVYPQHREMVKYLGVYRHLQSICDSPAFPAGKLSTTGGSYFNATGEESSGKDLAYCQCQGTGAGSGQSYHLMTQARRIHRNLALWKGQTPTRDPFQSFQRACQDGTAFTLPLPANLTGEDAQMIKNEQLCGQLQNLGNASVANDRCLCKIKNSYGSGIRTTENSGAAQNVSVDFRMSSEQFASQCLRISSETTTEQYCAGSSELTYAKESEVGQGAVPKEGCTGCPSAGSGSNLYRNSGESIITYSLRCMGIR